jgi:hypothetical protein
MNSAALTMEKPISAAAATASVANVVPFRKPVPSRAKLELVAPANAGRSWKEAVQPLAAAGNSNIGSARKYAIGDFALAGRGRGATTMPQALTNDDETHLTAMDFIAAGLIFLSAASGPALAWLLLAS